MINNFFVKLRQVFTPTVDERVDREVNTIRVMVSLFCKRNHLSNGDLCADCSQLLLYAEQRIEKCPHECKPPCNECNIHCYRKDYREQVRTVMRYSGPLMTFYHPWLAFLHFVDKIAARNMQQIFD